ncbi:MAG: cupin domain-containing protein [Chloroflexota bacterium]|nr:cupin domain-containing protein [Chloroflexota bacterium]
MPRLPITLALVAGGLVGLIATGALARSAQPPPNATPGSVGFGNVALGGIDPVVAPGYRLEMRENTFAPGAYVTRHTHPTAIIVCVQSGALGFAIQAGAATVTRGGTGATPEATEPLAVGVDIVLEPRDCVAFDEYAAHTEHTGWNASDGTTVVWETRLLKMGEPYTTFLDAQGTPVP